MSGSRVLVLPLMIDLVTWKSDTMNAIQKAMFNNHPIPRSAINHNKYKLCTINELPKKYSHHLWQNKIQLQTTYNEIVLVCVLNRPCATLVDVIQIYGNSNEWMGVGTNIFLSTDHLQTIYQPPTDHLPSTEHLPTTYWTVTNHFFTVQLVHYYHQYIEILRHYTG